MNERRVLRFVDAIIRNRRPRRFRATPDEAAVMQTAAALRGGDAGASEPTPEYVDRLAEQLRRAEAPSTSAIDRRRFLVASGVAAAAIGGIAADRLVAQTHDTSPDPAMPAATISPGRGRWVAVATLAELPVGAVRRFSTPTVEGFVVNRGGTISAISAICTHLGCTLGYDSAGAGRLVCPCHGARFGLDGAFQGGEYNNLPALPRLSSRTADGRVEVFVAEV